VLEERVGTEDVTENLIDLAARLRSEQDKEASFIELLERANSVADVLSVERELSRVRTEIERLQGQLGFIQRRVDLATITVTFTVPPEAAIDPPTALLEIEVDDVDSAVRSVRSFVALADGEVQRSVLTLNNGEEGASLVLLVPTAEFTSAISTFEALGGAISKRVVDSGGEAAVSGGEPEARIDLVIVSRIAEPDDGTSRWLTIGLPVGGAAAVVLLGLALVATYCIARRRGAGA
jgi:hypothetical protein